MIDGAECSRGRNFWYCTVNAVDQHCRPADGWRGQDTGWKLSQGDTDRDKGNIVYVKASLSGAFYIFEKMC